MITPPAHPALLLDSELTEIIRNNAAGAEKMGCLAPAQLNVIYAQNWFNLFAPKSLGGLQLALPQALALEEALAWADGSTGWTVTLCAGANWFAGFLHPQTAATVFSDNKVCLSGSGRPDGVAKIRGDGYQITGGWQYATGAPHATAFTANCVIEKDGIVLCNDDGSPLVKPFIFMRHEVVVFNDWHAMGMVATASHSFAVNNLYVAANRCFAIDAAHAVVTHTLYQYPFLQFAQATLAVNLAGMAARFIQLAEAILSNRGPKAAARPLATNDILLAKEQIGITRTCFYAAVNASWQGCLDNNAVSAGDADTVTHSCHLLVAACIQAVNALYPFCGLAAANTYTEINRVWRNLHTASQHTLLTPPHL